MLSDSLESQGKGCQAQRPAPCLNRNLDVQPPSQGGSGHFTAGVALLPLCARDQGAFLFPVHLFITIPYLVQLFWVIYLHGSKSMANWVPMEGHSCPQGCQTSNTAQGVK